MKKIIVILLLLSYTSIILNSETKLFDLDPNLTDAEIIRQLEDPNSKLNKYLQENRERDELMADLGI